ncbi:hypothetical protein [Glaciecola sp. SC05]|uniref:hypothetical protein n=1 Tax=Glaciecola sp. SC05 TaxID=1987355 RepID=UPI00352712CF
MKVVKLSISLLVIVLLSGCLSSDNDPAPIDDETAQFRVVHASSDAPTVNVLANGEVFGFLVGVDYQLCGSLEAFCASFCAC